jgi:hypothetical protein
MTASNEPLPHSTRALIEQLAQGDPEATLSMGELLDSFDERAFGLFLLLVMLPCFIPVPFGVGSISGGLAALVGAQLLFRFHRPWLPGFLARRPIHRRALIRFRDRMSRWLERLERLTRPRNEILFDHPLAHAFTGLLLIGLGISLALPVPLTNYPFGLILLCYAFALIERDGRLLAIAWILGLTEIGLLAGFSTQLTAWIHGWFA